MISRLKLKNWRSHNESEFKFSKGVNALLGIMGSGKSSVMDGMCYALFGTFPMLQQRKLKLNDIIRSKPNQAKNASVELDFINGGAVYTISREISLDKGTTNVELRKNGELLDAGNSESVNEHVEKILHIGYDIFSKAVYAEQNQLDYFLELPKGQRMAQIDSLLKLDRFETGRKNTTTLINKVEAERTGRENVAKSLFTEADKAAMQKLQLEIAELCKKISELNSQLEKTAKAREKAKKELESGKEAGKIAAEIDKINSERRAVMATLDVLKEELLSCGKISAQQPLTAGLFKEKEGLEKLISMHGTQKQVSAKIKKLKETELELLKKIERLETQAEYTGHMLKDMEDFENCPLCQAKLKTEHKKKLKDEHSQRVSGLKLEIKNFEKTLSEAKKECSGLENIFEAMSGLETAVKNAESEEKIKRKIAEEKEGRAAGLAKKQKETEEKLSELGKKQAELEEKAKKAGLTDMEKLEAAYESLILQEEKIKGQVKSSQALVNEKNERTLILIQKKAAYAQALADVLWLSNAKKQLDIFSSALVKTQEELRTEFIKIVNEVIAEIWPTLYPYGDITAVKLEVENRDYVLKSRTTAEWVNVEGITSGGERSLAALALRIAFSLALARNAGMLVLDEPTHNLDTNAIDELAITLRERLPNLIEQIFLITHEEKLEAAVSGYLYQLERNKELDECTRINLIASPEIE